MAKFQSGAQHPLIKDTVEAKTKVLSHVREGISVKQAMGLVGRQEGTLRQWLSRDAKFASALEDAKEEGATRDLSGDKFSFEFADFSKNFLNSSVFPHQQNWVDVLEGRAPSWLHPSMTYEPSDDKTRLLINVPPEHAKSTTITVNYSTYKICMDPDNTRIIVISKTLTKAQEFVYSIKQRLTHPMWAKMQATYAPPGGWREDADSWKANAITLSRNSTEKDPTVQALGIGGQVYGARANLIILDDCVTGANAHEWEKQLEWIQKEVITRLDDEGVLLVLGTRFAANDLYREIRNPKHWSNGKSPFTYFAMPAVLEFKDDPKNWVTLWPKTDQKSGTKEPNADGFYTKWNGPALYRRRGEVTPSTWALVYQQQDIQENSIFAPACVQGSINGMRRVGALRPNLPGHPSGGDFYTIMGIDPAMTGNTAAVVMAFERGTQKRYILDVHNMQDPDPQKIRALMEDWANKYPINEMRIEINAHQKSYALDTELNQYFASRGVQIRSHYTSKNKWDETFGVAGMASLFGTLRDGKHQDDNLIELPSSENNEHVKALINQLITWDPNARRSQKTDCVMALWFCEIRAKELVQQSGFMQTHIENRYTTRRGVNQRGVVNLDELAAQQYSQLYY
jgi:hypothetical protein